MAKTVLPDGSSKHEGGGYSVIVAKDGAINVKGGDSLSKYSMAIHGDFNHLNEYKHRRHKPTGPITDTDLAEIPNKNLINAGEILYHMPTRKESGNGTKPKPKPDPDLPWQKVAGLKKAWVLPENEFNQKKHNLNVKIPILHIGPFLSVGETWLSHIGKRTIADVWTGVNAIVFLLENPMSPYHNKLIIQKTEEFKDDLVTYHFDDLYKRTEPIFKLVEAEVYFFLGVISTINLPAFVAVTGLTLTHWAYTNREWLAKVDDAIRISCEVRRYMLANTPTLYDKLIDATLHHLWTNVPNIVGNVPEAIVSDPKLAGGGSGVILGHLTLFVAKGRFGAVALVAKILLAIAVKAIQAAPGAVVLTAQERAQYGLEIVTNLRQQGVEVSDADAQLIIDEVLANPEEVQSQLRKLYDAFEAIK